MCLSVFTADKGMQPELDVATLRNGLAGVADTCSSDLHSQGEEYFLPLPYPLLSLARSLARSRPVFLCLRFYFTLVSVRLTVSTVSN